MIHNISKPDIAAPALVIASLACGYPWYMAGGLNGLTQFAGMCFVDGMALNFFFKFTRAQHLSTYKWIQLVVAVSLLPMVLPIFLLHFPLHAKAFAAIAAVWFVAFLALMHISRAKLRYLRIT